MITYKELVELMEGEDPNIELVFHIEGGDREVIWKLNEVRFEDGPTGIRRCVLMAQDSVWESGREG